ncbi:MAG: zinc transporter ZntB [Alphaproteobacteria bacterium]|nr:zinc transporter ZntB [Alphaproteobacteria bacterium]
MAMDQASTVAAGRQAGLRFACTLDGNGGCRYLDWDGVRAWRPGDGVLWVHLERDDPHAQNWLNEECDVDPVSRRALLAEESRPRVEDVHNALLVVLRGVNLGADDDPEDINAERDLVPIHIWVEETRLITLRDKGHHLIALSDIRDALAQKRGPNTSGGLLVKIAEKLVKYAEPIIDDLEEQVEHLEDHLTKLDPEAMRGSLSEIRHAAIELRRYLAPQREALIHIQVEEVTWLTRKNRTHLRECADKVQRFIESLDTIRGRATLLHEDLSAVTSEKIAKSSHRLSILAALILPPSLLAGVFGANLGGIPGSQAPWALLVLCLVILVLIPIELWVLKRLKWF